jgi:hypothetical protein
MHRRLARGTIHSRGTGNALTTVILDGKVVPELIVTQTVVNASVAIVIDIEVQFHIALPVQ